MAIMITSPQSGARIKATGTPGAVNASQVTITVEGTFVDCPTIIVRLTCHSDPGDPDKPEGAWIDKIAVKDIPNGTWKVEFDENDIYNGFPPLTCISCANTPFSIQAFCEENTPNHHEVGNLTLDCSPQCPTVSNLGVHVGDCQSDGTRKVAVTGMINNLSGQLVIANIFLNDITSGSPAPNPLRIGQAINTNALNYDISTSNLTPPQPRVISVVGDSSKSYEIEVEIVYPAGCISTKSVSFHVPDCPKCPTVKNLNQKIDPCDTNGNVKVELTATIETKHEDVEYYWTDGQNKTTIQRISKGTQKAVQDELTYSRQDNRQRTVDLVIHKPPGCNITLQRLTFELPDCRCPENVALGYTVTEKPEDCDESGKRKVIFTVTGKARTGQTTKLELIDVTHSKPLVTNWPEQSGDFTLTETVFLTPGEYDVKPRITKPEGCGSTSTKVKVPPCPSGTELCPEIGDIQIKESKCTPDGKRTVEVTATVTPKGKSGIDTALKDITDSSNQQVIDQKINQTSVFILKSPSPQKTYTPGTNLKYQVEITKQPEKCPTAVKTKTHTVSECPQAPPQPESMSISCWILLIIALLMGLVACVLGIIAVCTGNWVLGIVAGILAALALLLIGLWAGFCAAGHCIIFDWIRWIVMGIIAVAPIVAIIVGLIGKSWICGLLAVAILWGYWGIVLVILDNIGPVIGCELKPLPFFNRSILAD
jgi:hypothetical protein